MKNDSKLGLLAGVGGVVVAAVLLTQHPAAPSAPTDRMVKDATVPAATPAAAVKPAEASAPSTTRMRSEIEGKTTSRSARDEDE